MRPPRSLGLPLVVAGLLGGVVACSGPTNPGEMPPLAPRPDPVQPTPTTPPGPMGDPDPSGNPVPGAPDPIDPSRTGPTFPAADGGVPITRLTSPQFRSDGAVASPHQAPSDGGAPR
ncbi:MAG: hypothetical protein M3680_31665, partial [Myxococcota bacterium]|nr:hypothetical protein [Myxococcota bacterium]